MPIPDHHRPAPPRRSGDWLVAGRERLLNAVLRIDIGRGVLNAAPHSPSEPATPGLATDIMGAINGFKLLAMDSTGQHVDYASLRDGEGYHRFRSELTPALRAFDPATLAGRRQKLAFWINLYNVLTMDAVIAFGVRDSVTEGRLGIARFFRRAAYVVGGQRVSLEDMEHGILRANRGNPFIPGRQFMRTDPRLAWAVAPFDPRIHFALELCQPLLPAGGRLRCGAHR